MRIAITGSHCVGKTTLAEELAAWLPTYDLWTEPYLLLEEAGYTFSDPPVPEDYLRQFYFSIDLIKKSAENVIFDRCPLDLMAYFYTTYGYGTMDTFYEEMVDAMMYIDLLVFVPIETPDRIGGQRQNIQELRYQVNDLLEDWIGDINNEIIEVTGTLDQRKKQIMNRINDK